MMNQLLACMLRTIFERTERMPQRNKRDKWATINRLANHQIEAENVAMAYAN